jgi:alpha-D-xyloside xylohydrolase
MSYMYIKLALAGLAVVTIVAVALAWWVRMRTTVVKDGEGVTIMTASGLTRVEVWGEGAIRIIHTSARKIPQISSLSVIGKPATSQWRLVTGNSTIHVLTPKVEVRIDRTTGAVRFIDMEGETILNESAAGSASGTVEQQFELAGQEAVYGLGQHQDGVMNYVGTRVHMQQENRIVAVPVLLSSKGYVVLWDNASVTDVDAGKTDGNILRWSSEAGEAVDYYLLYGPEPDEAIAAYRKLTGSAPMMARWTWGFWQCRERYSSQKQLLEVVAEYRKLGVPLDGIIQDWQYWEAGGWGSHVFDPNRYPDPAGMVKAVHDANAHIIISVWARFDKGTGHLAELEKGGAIYPPVYPNVYPKGEGKWYDAFNPEGRRIYWKQLSEKLFARGFDGWWLDASEAELGGKWGEMREVTTAAGPGKKVLNAYPLMHTTGIYHGQREETSDKRAFILTRSAYTGQQRNAAVTWSGDIKGSWEVFRSQIPAGLNFVATGIPYWNTDIGGFFGGDAADAAYAELFTRWFQYGAFCPMFRVHGTGQPKEIWRFDTTTQKIMADYIRLRYRLLPYIYSVSWKVTSEGYTMMRPLVMDFRGDKEVYGIADEYMFGPSLLVCPVTEPNARSRRVYLPKGTEWFDFWTGKSYTGGQTIEATSLRETMPLFVKAGAIIPLGPDVQYASEKPADPLELRIYRGAGGEFTLYEDEGDNYNYEKGALARIRFRWDEDKKELVIGPREGQFPGLLKERTLRIVWVAAGHGSGIAPATKTDKEVRYSGQVMKISVP